MTELRYAYNTNGCAHHRLYDALELMARAGYDGVALTLDWHHLDPFAPNWEAQTRRLARWLRDAGMGCVIETGARYLLDSTVKHKPTLLDATAAGRQLRTDFLRRALTIGAMLEAETVSCWAGVREAVVDETTATDYLLDGLRRVLEHARTVGCPLSLEPEPGMHVETNADYDDVRRRLGAAGEDLRLALDLGHVWVTGEGEPAAAIHQYADRLGTVSIEGMNRGVHLHLPLDEGDMAIPPLLDALRAVAFPGLVCVELSRESPRAHASIPGSLSHLRHLRSVAQLTHS